MATGFVTSQPLDDSEENEKGKRKRVIMPVLPITDVWLNTHIFTHILTHIFIGPSPMLDDTQIVFSLA